MVDKMDNQALAVLVAVTLFGAMAVGVIASGGTPPVHMPNDVIGYMSFSSDRNAVRSE
jgi:hypothetical protein